MNEYYYRINNILYFFFIFNNVEYVSLIVTRWIGMIVSKGGIHRLLFLS